MSGKWFLGAASAALVLAAAARADDVPVPYGSETVVTAGRITQLLSDSLRNVVVIGAREIEESGQLTLAGLLQLRGGVEIASSGGPGGASSVFMRGGNSAHTLVLVDGMRLSSATTGTTALENIPVSQIERIEIVSGPASSLYGSDAVGGLIQIFTKSGRYSAGTSVAAGIGTYGTRSITASRSDTVGDTDLTLSVANFATDGFSATNPSVSFGRFNPDNDGYRNSSLSGKLSHRFGPQDELGASILHSSGRAKYDDGPTTDPRIEQSLSTYSIFGKGQLAQGWQTLIRIGRSRDDSVDVAGDSRSNFRTDQDQATWQNTFQVAGGSLVAGAEYLGQGVATTTAYDVTKRTVRSFFGGYSGNFQDHGLQASLRRDDNSQFGRPGTGSLAYGYRVTDHLRLRAAYGSAFHAPTFNDLYYPGFGNAALRPERSHSREVGIDQDTGGHRTSITYFDNRVSDLIVFVFDPVTSSGQPENVARARTQGIELSYSGRILGARIGARMTIQDPKSLETGFQLPRRARQFGNVSATREFGQWRLGAEAVASGYRFDSATAAPNSRMGGYAVANVFMKRALSRAWSLEARWNNVANRKYEFTQGFNTAGSNVMVNVRWTPSIDISGS